MLNGFTYRKGNSVRRCVTKYRQYLEFLEPLGFKIPSRALLGMIVPLSTDTIREMRHRNCTHWRNGGLMAAGPGCVQRLIDMIYEWGMDSK